MSDSDSNNIVKKKGRPWRKTWELHRGKNRGRIGQECCGIWHLLSPLSWDDGSHLSPARVIQTSSYLQWWNSRGSGFKQWPLWGGKRAFVTFQWWDVVVAVSSHSKVKSAWFNSSVNRMFEYGGRIDQCACVSGQWLFGETVLDYWCGLCDWKPF